MIRMLLVLGLCFVGFGCSGMNLQKPTASVTGMSIKGVDANGFTLNFDVDIKNPNSVALPLTAADYKLGLGGVSVLEGKANPGGSIPAGGSTSVTLPVTLTYENLLAAEQAIVKSGGNVPYALDAGLSMSSGSSFMGSLRVPLQYSGTIPLKDMLNNPKIILQNPAALKLAKQLVGSLFGK